MYLHSHQRPGVRMRTLTLIGAVAGAVLGVAVPLTASAHIHVDPESVPAGTTTTVTFAFAHGCDDSPTTAIVIDIPEGVGNATPLVQGGWTIARDMGDDGIPTRVTFTSDSPVESGLKATVSMDLLFDEATANTSVAFPVTQECVAGVTAWTEVADEREDPADLESPAPVVAVGDIAPEGGHHAGASASASDHEEHASAAVSSTGDPVARWLAGGALAVGIAALVVASVRGRARKS